MAGKPMMGKRPQPTSVQAPSSPKPVKYRLSDLPGLLPEQVSELKGQFVGAIRLTARVTLSAEEVGVTRYVVEEWLKADLLFAEDVEHARQARIDEIEADLEGSTNRSGGDVTARIFMLKGYRPEKYHDRVVQETYSHNVYEPETTIAVLPISVKPSENAEKKAH